MLKTEACSYQSITPEDRESFRMGKRSVSASEENPVHVRGQPPQNTKVSCPNVGIYKAMTMELMTPAIPNWNLTVKSHDRNRWVLRLRIAR
jgi:hypothetical protein